MPSPSVCFALCVYSFRVCVASVVPTATPAPSNSPPLLILLCGFLSHEGVGWGWGEAGVVGVMRVVPELHAHTLVSNSHPVFSPPSPSPPQLCISNLLNIHFSVGLHLLHSIIWCLAS